MIYMDSRLRGNDKWGMKIPTYAGIQELDTILSIQNTI
jgi:hypothetical protein